MQGNTARAVLFHPEHGERGIEHGADVIVVAAGAMESARLLLLSAGQGEHAQGIGNASNFVGKNLGFHHIWWGHLHFAAPMFAGRIGPPTMTCHQFLEPEGRRNYGGASVELFDYPYGGHKDDVARRSFATGPELVAALRPVTHCRVLNFHAETVPGPRKYLELSATKDRFGDPFAHVHYELDDFDHATHETAKNLTVRFKELLGAESGSVEEIENFWSGHHHLGTCRMGQSIKDSVVDSYGAVHGTKGLFVCGGSNFVTTTPLQPTLTMVALAIRTAERIAREV
jgi:choline dehydrogenase-like flavoprotein